MKWMKFTIVYTICTGCLILNQAAQAAGTNEWPPFQEVYDMVRKNLAGANEADLNRAAVEGFLNQLRSQVSMDGQSLADGSSLSLPMIPKTNLIDEAYGYLRIANIAPGLDQQMMGALGSLGNANRLKGIILDLRYARSQDYKAAAAVADRFLATEHPLLSWDGQTAKSTAKTNALTMPVVVLTNRKTAGAAEALAAILRQNDAALLIGSPTAGQATVFQEFTLSNGRQLRIVTGTVRVSSDEPLGFQGIKPDIQVAVNADDESAFYADPYKVLARNLAVLSELEATNTAATNLAARHRINEAELVRMQKEGQNLNDTPPPTTANAAEPAKPSIQDPVLARGLDLLKGLALVQRSKGR